MSTLAALSPSTRNGLGNPARGEQADIAVLLDGAHEVASAATGEPVRGLEIEAVHHRPGAGVSVVYRLRRHGTTEHLVASTARRRSYEGDDGVVTLDDGVRSIRVWWRHDDPGLPGLRGALDPVAVGGWLGDPGVAARTEVLSYRPGRRAVVSARVGSDRAFIKVLRPGRGADLLRRHSLVGVAPHVVANPTPDVVVLGAARGRSLAQALASRDDALLPSPDQVVGFLRALPTAARDLPRRPSWSDRVDFHAAAARGRLPEHAPEISRLESRLRQVIDGADAGPLVTTHGDLNVANLFVDGGRPAALIDLDSLGPGHLVDDVATLLAHLHVLPYLAPRTYPQVPAVVAAWTAAFERIFDPVALHARTGAVLLSLVAGADVEQAQARLGLASRALGRATGAELL